MIYIISSYILPCNSQADKNPK